MQAARAGIAGASHCELALLLAPDLASALERGTSEACAVQACYACLQMCNDKLWLLVCMLSFSFYSKKMTCCARIACIVELKSCSS